MNLYKAYVGAVSGLSPYYPQGHVRDIQYAIATELAAMRMRYVTRQVDGHMVSNADLRRLKDRGEKRIK